ncbi:hypothetical protein [Actinophytocola sp. NPDC049390]|uniref:hypothetical protein n=1 Tax=Actinophytocola sp. NPDC049390 TaxID=3363894 RepID=UPI0037976245
MNAYVIVKDGCPLALSVLNPDQVEIVCGWPPNRSFDFVMHREALRAFVQLGTEALERMDAALAADDPAPSVPAC